MKTLLIVYHSMTGGTRQMARAAAEGAADAGEVDVRLARAADAGPDQVLSADAYLFATPENLAAMSGVMKDFFDRTYYAALGKIEGRPYVTLVCAGSDGSGALQQVERIATGWHLRRVCAAVVVCTNAQTPDAIRAMKVIADADLRRCHEQGATLAAGLAAGIY